MTLTLVLEEMGSFYGTHHVAFTAYITGIERRINCSPEEKAIPYRLILMKRK